ncbi:alpha/beta hydrolase [Streptomyces sp. ERV7]|uniref:alpha/beta fold hydrolase n=1 Tax=Streptomyces sp. ERV7 TaxID=1322334 RepID=UPI0007F38703|nr:alpha/beta hydrolase [Streptomyces sp. ERV7]OAR22216.1 alpha/beta hydrolase [Streptomyces sp. ERV7]
MSLDRRKMIGLGAGSAALAMAGGVAVAEPATAAPRHRVPSDAALARSLSGGFRSRYAHVNGVRLHYVAGGSGTPVVLLAGWPQTWWAWRHVMPELARRHRVIAVDIRGMGGSDKPQGGYDKKTMAGDVHALVRSLGYSRVNMVGHDMGAMVAFSFAANHPAATRRLALLDTLHVDETQYDIPLLPRPDQGFNLWWWAFNQVQGLPEQLAAGRMRHIVDWLFANSLPDQALVPDFDRAVYAHRYDSPDAVRAGAAWYKAAHQDIADLKTYGKVTAPVLGIGSRLTYDQFRQVLPTLAADVRVVCADRSIHYIPEEQPELLSSELLKFLV